MTVEHLRKAAKRWLKSLRAGDADARARLERAVPGAPANVGLRDVQHALARERGHRDWIALTRAAAAGAESPLTALLAAAERGDAAAVAALLDAHPVLIARPTSGGARSNAEGVAELIDQRGALPGHTGLRTALHFGVAHAAVVRALLERGADPNIRDDGDLAFPLHFAAERGDLAVVELLVEHGADVTGAGTVHELDVLGWAVCFDAAVQAEVARYLLAHGARHTLLSAIALGDVAELRALAAAGADLAQRMDRTNHRRTPLHLAVAKRQPAAAAALIELGAELDAEDATGMTPLDLAIVGGSDELARALLDAGAALTLPAAIALERTADVERLVREDPDALAMTSRQRWARLVVQASARASGRVLDALLRTTMQHRAGLSVVNVEDEDTAVDGASGYTPLHAAAFHGNDEAVAVLLRHGANARARDGKFCATPAGWAAHAEHTGTVNLLLEAEIDIFEAIEFGRADRVADILDRDPGALDRPFKAYATCPSRDGQWWPTPDCTPLAWATEKDQQGAVRILTERGAAARTPEEIRRTEWVAAFLQAACWDGDVHGKREHRVRDRVAQRLLAQEPWIARDSIYTAVVCGDRDEVARILDERPAAALKAGGPRGWTPILYLAYTRFTHPPVIANALAIAQLLLDAGANPDDFYMAGDARYSVLTGIAGEGEQDAPRQPYAAALLELVLEHGAEPFDIQILYNTHFSGDILWWLEIVYAQTIETPRGAAWRDPEWAMLDMGAYGSGARFLLETAVKKRDGALAAWVLARGANPNAAPARDRRFPTRSLYELAVLADLPELAELLARHGAARIEPVLDERERFFDACLRLDRDAAERWLREHPDALRSPAAMFEAARRDRPDVLGLLLELGFSIEVADATGKRALHEAAAAGALRAARFLVERGAEIDPLESTYGGPPIGWAAHGDHTELVEFLAERSRHVPPDEEARIAELLAATPPSRR